MIMENLDAEIISPETEVVAPTPPNTRKVK